MTSIRPYELARKMLAEFVPFGDELTVLGSTYCNDNQSLIVVFKYREDVLEHEVTINLVDSNGIERAKDEVLAMLESSEEQKCPGD